jgi:hypothetical protein
MASDAYATGQALYALHAAGIPRTDAAVQQGLEFLVRTQTPDGNWKMLSRPDPKSGKPAEFLVPITYAAAAWATLGMVEHVPQAPEK